MEKEAVYFYSRNEPLMPVFVMYKCSQITVTNLFGKTYNCVTNIIKTEIRSHQKTFIVPEIENAYTQMKLSKLFSIHPKGKIVSICVDGSP